MNASYRIVFGVFGFVGVLVIGACAESGRPEERSAPVIFGEPSPEGLFPATGALMYDGDVGCSGTLVHPRVVLTAAHCVSPDFIGDVTPGFTVVLDATTATAADITPGASTHVHPDFDLFADVDPGVQHWFDIGVLILAQPVDGVEVEALPTVAEAESALVAGAEVDLVGYGRTDLDSFDFGVKHHGRASLVEVGDWELWISEPGQQQNCHGDSGSPALIELPEGGRRIVGVVSRAPDDPPTCENGGIDTRVDAYLDWIYSVAPQLCEPGVPCVGDADAGPPDAGPPDAAPPDAMPLAPDATPDEPDAMPAGDDGTTDGCAGCRANASHDDRGASWILLAIAVAVAASRRRR